MLRAKGGLKMITNSKELWLEEKQNALYDALEEIENVLNYGESDVPYYGDFDEQIEFIKDNIGYLEELEKDIEKFLESDIESQGHDVNIILEEIAEILWIDENNLPYNTTFGYKMVYIARKFTEIKRVLRNLQGTLDDYDRDEPWYTGID